MNAYETNAYYSNRYGWTLKNNSKDCKTCGHECHCSNEGSCCGGECHCNCCEHKTLYEPNNA